MGRVAVFVWVTLWAGIAAAGEIHGVVLDSVSGAPVPSATVTVASSQRQLTVPTDAQGHYAVEELPPGEEYSVLIAYGGVHVQHAHVDVIDGKTTALEDKLEVPAELITVRERAIPTSRPRRRDRGTRAATRCPTATRRSTRTCGRWRGSSSTLTRGAG